MSNSAPALVHFEHHDPKIASLLKRFPDTQPPTPQLPELYFYNLCKSIVSQQLSIKAADTIWHRVCVCVDNQLTPVSLLGCGDESLRTAGLSRQKITYMKALANFSLERPHAFLDLDGKSNDEVITLLTEVKGIGRWTAEMFLIFTMGRTDVFSLGDLGLRRGFERLYGPDELFHADNPIIQNYHPYSSTAALLLWRSLDAPLN